MTQPIPALVTIPQAASILGIPSESLRGAAEKHGYIVRMGRAVRLETIEKTYGHHSPEFQESARAAMEKRR